MPNALDAFKAQREAANAAHAEFSELSSLVRQLRAQIDGLVPELKALLRDQQQWLAKTHEVVLEERRWREREEPRFLRGILWRWILAAVFALAAAGFCGAGYAWITEPWAAELQQLRSRAALSDLIQIRLENMTADERRQFDSLMRLTSKRERDRNPHPSTR
jgi:hypothetical protein